MELIENSTQLEKKGSIISVVGKSTLEMMSLFSCRQKVPYDL